jgi:electron transport complex protein RnfG
VKTILRLALNLALLCLFIGIALGLVNSLTKDRIEAQEREARERAMRTVMKPVIKKAEEVRFEPLGKSGEIFQVYDKERNLLGWVVRTKSSGYSSIIEISYGVNRNNRITGMQILSQNETAGLGTKIAAPWFYGQFQGKGIEDLTVKRFAARGKNHIAAITGATISSEAVTRGIRESLAKFIKERSEER